MADNGAGKLLGKLKDANESTRLAKLKAVFTHEEGQDVLPLIIVDPSDPERLRGIPVIGAGGGAIPGTRSDKLRELDEWDGGQVAKRGLAPAQPRQQPPKVRIG